MTPLEIVCVILLIVYAVVVFLLLKDNARLEKELRELKIKQRRDFIEKGI